MNNGTRKITKSRGRAETIISKGGSIPTSDIINNRKSIINNNDCSAKPYQTTSL